MPQAKKKKTPLHRPRNFVAGKYLEHPTISKAIDQTLLNIKLPHVPVTLIIGPTGVGKSFLREYVTAAICRTTRQPKLYRPAVGISVKVLSDKRANWGALYRKLLKKLRWRATPAKNDILVERIKEAVVARKTKVVFLDEVHHILPRKQSESSGTDNADVLKSLTQDIPVKLVLLGTYRALPLVETNDEMARRVKVIHIPRYQEIKDRDLFRQILKYIDKESRSALGIKLADQPDYIYKGCCGMIGILSTWLANAKETAKLMRSRVITQAALEEARLSNPQIDKIERRTLRGERFLRKLGYT